MSSVEEGPLWVNINDRPSMSMLHDNNSNIKCLYIHAHLFCNHYCTIKYTLCNLILFIICLILSYFTQYKISQLVSIKYQIHWYFLKSLHCYIYTYIYCSDKKHSIEMVQCEGESGVYMCVWRGVDLCHEFSINPVVPRRRAEKAQPPPFAVGLGLWVCKLG